MADEKKKPAPKKEPKPEAGKKPAEKKAAKGGGDSAPAKGPAKAAPGAAAPLAEGQPAPAAEATKPAEGAPAAAPTAAELLADELAGKKIIKAKGAKNIVSGIANILATFNNTLVSITDMQGHLIGWATAGRVGFKGLRQRKGFAAPQGAPDAAPPANSHG